MQEKLNQLRASLGPDGVHLTEVGRMHLFNNLVKVILDMKSGTLGRPPKTAVAAASSSVTGKTFYWRGFVLVMVNHLFWINHLQFECKL
jgi:hypothetical protein